MRMADRQCVLQSRKGRRKVRLKPKGIGWGTAAHLYALQPRGASLARMRASLEMNTLGFPAIMVPGSLSAMQEGTDDRQCSPTALVA